MAFKSTVIDRMMAKDLYLQLSVENHLQGRRMDKFRAGTEILIPRRLAMAPFPESNSSPLRPAAARFPDSCRTRWL